MSSLMHSFEKRYWDLKDEIKWKPEIYMPNKDGIITDFVPFITPTATQQITFLGSGYPENASFCFHGYHGIVDKDRIIRDIKSSAFGSGSKIRASCRSASRSTKNRICTVQFFCVRHKMYNNNYQTYNEECIQAVGTILQKEHMSRSRPGRSLNDHVTPNESLEFDESPAIKRRRTTSIRPMSREACCPFGFTVFCCENDKSWYLLFHARYVLHCAPKESFLLLWCLNILSFYNN